MRLTDFIAGFAVLVAAISIAFRSNSPSAKPSRAKLIDRFPVGHYIFGLPTCSTPTPCIECAVIGGEFVFRNDFGIEIGRIRRHAVTQVSVDAESQIFQRLTISRAQQLGPLAVAEPPRKTHRVYALMITWEDAEGTSRHTVFEFGHVRSRQMASGAAGRLKTHVPGRYA
jgi:hypothetical protein